MRASVIRRAIRTEPEPPTKMPRWPSGSAKKAVRSATRICVDGGKLQPAADDGAVQRGDEWDRAALDRVEDRVPAAGAVDAFDRRFFGVLGNVEASGEMIAFSVDYRRPRLAARTHDRRRQFLDHRVGDCVPFLRAIEPDERDLALQRIFDKRIAHADLLPTLFPSGRNSRACVKIVRWR